MTRARLISVAALACLMAPWGFGTAAAVKPPRFCFDARRDLVTSEGFHNLNSSPVIPRQGATIRITPTRTLGPAGPEAVPLSCISKWRVSDRKLVRLARDRRSFRIAPDAPPGSEFSISYVIAGRKVEGKWRVIARDAVVLTGTRGQAGESCGPYTRVGEIEFGPGSFSVTFQPFETYKDYWGGYRFDPATGALKLEVTGGNKVPYGLDLEGTARFTSEGKLELDGFYLGSANPGAPPAENCRYIFG